MGILAMRGEYLIEKGLGLGVKAVKIRFLQKRVKSQD